MALVARALDARFLAISILFEISAPKNPEPVFLVVRKRAVITAGKLLCRVYSGANLRIKKMTYPAMINRQEGAGAKPIEYFRQIGEPLFSWNHAHNMACREPNRYDVVNPSRI